MRPFILLITIFGFSCKNPTARQEPKKFAGKQFFDFDRVIYFSSKISEIDAENLLTKENLTTSEKKFSQIISGDNPSNLNEIDTIEFAKLSLKKTDLEKATFPTIRQIFVSKEKADGTTMSCIPVYRDILVFLNNGKICGFAKICFGCHQYQFLGAKTNTETFGSDTDYEKLRQILN